MPRWSLHSRKRVRGMTAEKVMQHASNRPERISLSFFRIFPFMPAMSEYAVVMSRIIYGIFS
jgi:hypothetical protein